jgi:hypothetical protein
MNEGYLLRPVASARTHAVAGLVGRPGRVNGPRRDTLFVTTARTDLDDDALARQPHAGKVFAIDGLGARGLPCLPYRGRAPRSFER